jgi:hypothetical protein
VTTTVHADDGDRLTVTFFNQPRQTILVHKTAVLVINNGPEQNAPNDDDGWVISIISKQCNYVGQQVTDANGDATFNSLPFCNDFVVSENPVNAGSPGFNPAGAISVRNLTPGPETNPTLLTFKNRKILNDPSCPVGCSQTTPTVPPTTPATNPPTTVPTTVAPTNAPTNTPTNTPATNIAGERTPGSASPTPIAPSTGGGLLGADGGVNILLILGGLLALSSGLSVAVMGRCFWR